MAPMQDLRLIFHAPLWPDHSPFSELSSGLACGQPKDGIKSQLQKKVESQSQYASWKMRLKSSNLDSDPNRYIKEANTWCKIKFPMSALWTGFW